MSKNYAFTADGEVSLRRLEASFAQAGGLFMDINFLPPFIDGELLANLLISGKENYALAGDRITLAYPARWIDQGDPQNGLNKDFWHQIHSFDKYKKEGNTLSYYSYHNVPTTIKLITKDDPLIRYFENPDFFLYAYVFQIQGNSDGLIYKDHGDIGVPKNGHAQDVASVEELPDVWYLPNPSGEYLRQLKGLNLLGKMQFNPNWG